MPLWISSGEGSSGWSKLLARIRTFIAFGTPLPIREAMTALQAELRASEADVRWESPEKFHATIKFLGDVEEAGLPGVLDDARSACASSPPFSVSYEGLGAFPALRHPRVVWIGCVNEDGVLGRIKDALDAGLLARGFPVEERAFHPHVTLGRVRSPRGLHNLTPILEKLTFEPRTGIISEILVMKSLLRPQGAEYSVVTSIHLQP